MKYFEKTIEYGLYLLAFLLPIQTRWMIRSTGLEYTTISLYGTDILLIVLLGLFFSGFKDWPRFKIKSIWSLILLIDTAAFISIFIAPDKWLALAVYLRLLLAFGLFWVIIKAGYDKWKLGYSLIGGLFLQSLLAIWQFLSQSAFSSKWLGIASHSASGLNGESVIEAAGGRWLRAYGGLDHPNILGGALAIGIVLMLVAVLEKIRREWSTDNWKEKIKTISIMAVSRQIAVFYAILLTMVTALFFTFSRASWAGLAIAIFSMAFYFIAKKKKEEQFVFGKMMLAICFVFFILNFIYGPLVASRANFSGRLENKSISERMRYFNDFKSTIKDNWLFGAGIGNYSTAVEKKLPGRPAYNYQPVHNSFFLIWSEIGIIGLIGFIGLLINLVSRNCLSQNKLKTCLPAGRLKIGEIDQKYSRSKLYGFVFIPVFVLLALDHWLWSLHFGIYFFFIIAGYLYRQADVSTTSDQA